MINQFDKLTHINKRQEMFDELYEQQSKTVVKAYLIVIFGIILVVYPIKEFISFIDHQKQFKKILNTLQMGSVSQIPLNSMLPLFEKTPYRGKWRSQIKSSYFLKAEEGIIELRTFFTKNKEKEGYTIQIRIFNGSYLDNGRYDVIIDSESFIAKQRLQAGLIIYQSDRPFIAFYKKSKDSTNLFHEGDLNSLFISKLKIGLKVIQSQSQNNKPQGLKLQLLLYSENKINIGGESLEQYPENHHDIFLSLLLVFQCCLQISGVFYFYNQIYRKRQCGSRYSLIGFMMATCSDGVLMIFLFSMCLSSQIKFAIYGIPSFLLCIQLLFMELKILQFIDHQYKDNHRMFYVKVLGTMVVFYALTYFVSLDRWVFIIYSCSILFPQIYRNYVVGHKMKSDLQKFFMFSLPRYTLLLYLRAFKYNVFNLKPNYLVTMAILCLILVQVLILLAQKKYGVRAILPKFMHPSQFKYFMNEPQTQDQDCSICLVSLREQPPQMNIISEEEPSNKRLRDDIYNNVVLTPCGHKFHIECLVKWMETKLQCPNCRTILPPVEDYQ